MSIGKKEKVLQASTRKVRADAELEETKSVNEERKKYRDEQCAELRDRLLFVLDDFAPSRGKYHYLELRTGIPATRWQNLYLEKQLPTLDMLLAMNECRPYYLHWILTGHNLGNAREIEIISFQHRAPKEEKWITFLEHRSWLRSAKEKKNVD